MWRSQNGFLISSLVGVGRGDINGEILDDKWWIWQQPIHSSFTLFKQLKNPPGKANFKVNIVLLIVRGWDNELLSSSLPCFIYSISGLRRLQATNKRPADPSLSLAPFSSAIFDTDVLINAPH